jgi:hypothetical protein
MSFRGESEEQPKAAAVPARDTAFRKSRREKFAIFESVWIEPLLGNQGRNFVEGVFRKIIKNAMIIIKLILSNLPDFLFAIHLEKVRGYVCLPIALSDSP